MFAAIPCLNEAEDEEEEEAEEQSLELICQAATGMKC